MIGLRYTRAKRRNHFISFISFSSMLGIALGVAVLITVLSVMNGFDEEIHQQIFGMVQHVTVMSEEGNIYNWQNLQNRLQKFPRVLAAAPFVNGQGLLVSGNLVRGSYIAGVLPEQEKKVSVLAQKMIVGSLDDLKPNRFGVVIGEELANSLNLSLGDKISVMIPQVTVSLVGMTARYKRFTVVGIFQIGGGFRFDNSIAFINMRDAQKLFAMGDAISGIRLKIADVFAAPRMSYELSAKLGPNYLINNWTSQFGPFFKTIKLEKNMMFLILLLIIAVAAFNLVSSLVMVVTDKRSDIAILRTLGATPGMIVRIFMIQGCVLGFFGTFLGVFGGILLAKNVTAVVNGLQNLLNMKLISADIYFIDYLPSKIIASDILEVTFAALLMSFLATIYPAWRAAKTEPAEALRYE